MYRFFFEGNRVSDTTKLLRLTDIPASMKNHYNLQNARVVAHSLVQFFMLYDKRVFNICNSMMFLGVGILILLHIQPEYKKWKPWSLAAVYLSMWILLPAVGFSVLWLSGACNYLWMCAVILLFLLPYRVYILNLCRGEHPYTMIVITAITGFLAGASKENGGGAAILWVLLFFIVYGNVKRFLYGVSAVWPPVWQALLFLCWPQAVSGRSEEIFLSRVSFLNG